LLYITKEDTLTALYNQRPTWLVLMHEKLDAAVFAANGWPSDLSDAEILERLLALNLERSRGEASLQIRLNNCCGRSPDRATASLGAGGRGRRPARAIPNNLSYTPTTRVHCFLA